MLRAVVVLLTLGALGCPAAQTLPDKRSEASGKPTLTGSFASKECLATPAADGTTSYVTRAVDLAPSTWAVDVIMYGDEKCSAKQGTIRMEGAYTIGNPSLAVPGAFEADFVFSKRVITPHVDGFIALLQSLSCGKAPYAVNDAQDILVAGCKDLGFRSVKVCAKDHDLLKVEGDGTLRFGKRPLDNDLCDPGQRPTELGAIVFKPVT